MITDKENSTCIMGISPDDIEVDLITELAAPIISINNLFLLKLDNDDLYLINPNDGKVIWKSESQNISLRTK